MGTMVSFLLLNLSLPILIRFISLQRRRSVPFYAQLAGAAQDLFIVLELSLVLPFSVAGAAVLGFLIHLVLLMDAFLFQKMQLRMRLIYFYHLRHIRSLIPSAKELGLKSFIWIATLIFLGQLLGYLFLYESASFSWKNALVCLIAGALSTAAWRLPKPVAYAVNHILFQEQINLFSRLCRLLKNNPTSPHSRPFSIPAHFSGPKQFEVAIDPDEKPHIVFLFLESFAAQAVNSDQDAAPHFKRLSKEGILFSQFYSNGTLTYRALISGLFGMPPANTACGLAPYLIFR